MRNNITWEDGRVRIDPPHKPKKITGTRFASIQGANRWNTPFQMWCEITKAYSRPFEGNKYTEAGQILEPKIMHYLSHFFFGDKLISPTDVYGPDPFKKTFGDFFKNESAIFGGMWDGLIKDGDEYTAVVEIKTTKRAEDWYEGAPKYYELQAALYAYLLGIDKVYMVGAFLEDNDYDNLERFVPRSSNTLVYTFLVSEHFPDFDRMIDEATEWYENHILTGVSPPYDERADAEYLKALRTERLSTLNFKKGIKDVIAQAETLEKKLLEVKESVKEDAAKLKELDAEIKAHMEKQLSDGSNRVTVDGDSFRFELLKSTRSTVDIEKLKEDGLFEDYATTTETLRLTKKRLEDA